MKTIIRLTESDLHRLVKESVRNIIMEYKATQYDNLMQRSMDNGAPEQVWDEYLAQQDTYYGMIAKTAMQNGHRYTDILRDLQNKIGNYQKEGRFGTDRQVIDTIGKFCSLLAYLNGAYESAIKKLRNNGVSESLLREWNPFAGITYKDTNKYGVKQKIGDDRRGQWMKNLQAELRQMLKWNYLHGPKTVEATEAFIEFLEVEKRGLMAFGPLKKMAISLAGVVLLGNVLNVYAPGTQNNPVVQPQQQQPQVQQVQQQQQQGDTIYFQVNSAELTPGAIQKLQKLAQGGGTFEVIVHESQNSSGVDARNENSLIQARIDAIGQYVNVSTATRGTNNQLGQLPSVEINPVN